jgi:peptide/nickel transport system ATP-binding protein
MSAVPKPDIGQPVLEVEDLSVDIATGRGPLRAVRHVSFAVARGETLCIVGESGCGKSITSLAVMSLLPPAATRRARRLKLAGEDLLAATPKRVNALRGNRMTMIFQEPMTALNPAYTIGNQLTEVYLHHRGGGEAKARDRAVELLGKVGIASAAERMGQYPHQLSGGLRQRVMIAMALMCGPELLIADEPSTALDVTIQAQILRLLADLQQDLGIAMVLITHDLGVVARIAHRVAVMYAGEIVEEGDARSLFASPRHPYTRGLLSCIPVPGRTARGGRLGTIAGVVPSLVGEIRGCSFRERCGYARPECAAAVPVRGHEGHRWLCIHEELPAERARDALVPTLPPHHAGET